MFEYEFYKDLEYKFSNQSEKYINSLLRHIALKTQSRGNFSCVAC